MKFLYCNQRNLTATFPRKIEMTLCPRSDYLIVNSCHTEEHYPLPYGLAVYCQRFEITRIGKLGSKYDTFNAFLAVSNPHIHLKCSKFSTHFRFTADQKFYPKIFFHYQSMPIKILARVP